VPQPALSYPIDNNLRRLLDAAAILAGLPAWPYRDQVYTPGELLEGLVLTESSGNTRARRYEAHQDRADRRDAPQDPDTDDRDDGELEDDASYGLMQVMGYNVRRLCGLAPGTAMTFAWLYLPVTNIAFGLRILLGEISAVRAEIQAGKLPGGGRDRLVDRALARYNGGPTGDDLVGGAFRLQAYVDKVGRCAEQARVNRLRMGWRS
jgi:hypothetical protein